MQNTIFIQLTTIEFKDLLKASVIESIKEIEAKDKSQPGKLLSIKEAASFLNLAQQTIYGFTSQGTIPFLKKGKKLYFKKPDLEKWINEGRKRTKQEIEDGISQKGKGGTP